MPKAADVAADLYKLADSLRQHPNLDIKRPWISFYCDTKQEFLNGATVLPRPFNKSVSEEGSERWARIRLRHVTDAIDVDLSVLKSLTCELVEPAKPAVYRCDPILSALEEASLAD